MSGKKQNGPQQIELPLFGARRAPEEVPPVTASADRSSRTAEVRPAPPVATAVATPVVAPVATPSASPRPGFRVIQGGGQRKHESLGSRDAVVRCLVEAGADLLLRRITPERADEIERKVDRVLRLFDQVDHAPELMPVLQRQLDDLEALMRETRQVRSVRR